MKTKTIAFALPALGMILPLSAAVTYLEVDASNTTLSNGTAMVLRATGGDRVNPEDYISGTGGENSNFWKFRTGVYSNGVWQSGAVGGNESIPSNLRFNFGNGALTPGQTYNVFGFYQSNGGNWDATFGLNSTALTGYDRTGSNGNTAGTLASTLTFTGTAPTLADGTTNTYAASLGTAIADVNGDIFVFAGAAGPYAGDTRTHLDGIGFEAVPEPSTALLGGLGLLLAAGRRSRKG